MIDLIMDLQSLQGVCPDLFHVWFVLVYCWSSLNCVMPESIRERRRYGDMAKMSVESLPFKQINGYACGGPAAQIEWLSRPEVMRALNIPSDAQFFQSDNGVGFTYELTEKDLISWYKDIISQNKLKIMVYNGDTDPCINAFQAQNWTRNLGNPITIAITITIESRCRLISYII